MKKPDFFKQLFALKKQELRIVAMSAGYFFLLLCAYYILRPIREAMGIARSAEDLPYLFLATMAVTLIIAPIIGALVSRYQRNQFIPIAYYFISFNLLLFFAALKLLPPENLFYVGIVFYVWLTVINLLLVSLFWGFMSDGISFADSKRLFPGIAIGGTIGAIFGSNIAQHFIALIGQSNLLLIAVALLYLALQIMKKIDTEFNQNTQIKPPELPHQSIETASISAQSQPTGFFSNSISGIRFALASPYILAIALYIFFYSITSTFLYFQQGQLVAESTTNSVERIQIFANIDSWTNLLTLALQLFISRQLLMRFGVGAILLGLPLLTLLGFTMLSFYPTLAVLILFQSLRRALNYGLFKPAREILFTVIPTEQKYKAKSFVDTFFYRGGDAAGAVTQKALIAFQLGITSIALIVVPIAFVWSVLAIYLGIQAKRKSQ